MSHRVRITCSGPFMFKYVLLNREHQTLGLFEMTTMTPTKASIQTS